MIKINPFKKSYKGKCVIDFPGAELQIGKIYAVIGANGSGKSSFAKAVSGIIKTDTGLKPVAENLSIGYMPQKSYGYRMKLISNLLLAANDTGRADKLISALKLSELKNQRADKLSGGETARMALARLMMKDFELLILDEPCASMDMESTLLAEKQILSYRGETGCCIILITHSVQQARRCADEILFFKNGRLIEMSESEELLRNPKKDDTRHFLEFYGI